MNSFQKIVTLCLMVYVLPVAIATRDKEYIEHNDFHWRGELPMTVKATRVDATDGTKEASTVWNGKVTQVSWSPRAYLFENFLSDEEADHIIALASQELKRSSVVNADTGGSFDSDVRTSWGTFLAHEQDEIIARIERRIATVTMLPMENGESLQVLRYVDGQKYEPHTDYFHDKYNIDPKKGGQRLATMLMYLSTPEEGGETVFPYSENKPEYGPGWSDCARKGLAVKAIKGNAILFFSQNPDGSVDPASTHAACPVTKGVKWSAPKWIHGSSVRPELSNSSPSGPRGCIDLHEHCQGWAKQGECKTNPGFMLENCRKSCGQCYSHLGRKDMS